MQPIVILSLLAVGIMACQDVPSSPTDLRPALAVTASDNPFVGSWESTDPLDGSHQHMTVGGGPNMPAQYRDDAGTICNAFGFGFVPATIHGFAVITDDDPFTFEFTGDVYCHNRGAGGRQVVVENVTLAFTYNPETDTLFSNLGLPDCWYRSGSPESCG
jgi:hypothetical protein